MVPSSLLSPLNRPLQQSSASWTWISRLPTDYQNQSQDVWRSKLYWREWPWLRPEPWIELRCLQACQKSLHSIRQIEKRFGRRGRVWQIQVLYFLAWPKVTDRFENLQIKKSLNLFPLYNSAFSTLLSSLRFLTRRRKSALQTKKANKLATWKDSPATRMFVPMSIFKVSRILQRWMGRLPNSDSTTALKQQVHPRQPAQPN